jgi:hypothetical protein
MIQKLILTAGSIGLTILSASALQVTLQQGAYSYGVGGEFVAAGSVYSAYQQYYSSLTKYHGNNGYMGFATFCIEYNEEFTPGSTYDVRIGPNAMYGSAGTGGDPISRGTAYLYQLFATGHLPGYNYSGAGRAALAGQLQQTIWWLEGEGPGGVPVDPGILNPFRQLVVNKFGGVANAMADNNGLYSVAVMVLDKDGKAQDQLILVPEASETAILLGFGVIGLCLFRRTLTA